MIITYFRSSSYNTWDMCQFQWFLVYMMGIKDPGKLKTHKGSIVHKAVELLGRLKKARQDGHSEFSDAEIGKTWKENGFGRSEAIAEAWEHYTTSLSHFDWANSDLEDCDQWFENALTWNDGVFNPLNRTIVEPEQYFDFEIDKPWAKYSQRLPDGEVINGTLALKGTMDLLVEVDGMPGMFELLDWKTGRRLDWANGKIKDYDKLRSDPQLRLYHYALSKIYPDIKQFVITIVYLQHHHGHKSQELRGGPFTLPYGPEDLVKTEEMIRRRFEAIRNVHRPKQRITWRCNAFCHFGKTKQEGSDKTICEFMHDSVKQIGADLTVLKYGDLSSIGQYGEGGGRKHEQTQVDRESEKKL